ncbi:HAD family hydrolase [Halopiger goleimassiliensis]|uniref:HAD family hydrolase n=1 Tax=Halopiger goleimassiliensis TaxID=1293048 RepID=UPI001E41F14E|nr:HAD family hydrolase [Halopiger goleimassiliensis]
MTTSVYFDLDGTLLEYTRPFDEIFADVMPAGVDVTESMAAAYSERVLAGLDDLEDDPYEQAFAAICREYDVSADPAALAAERVRTEVAATRVPESVRRLVELVARDHDVGILTNGDGRMQRRKLEVHGLDDLVDTIVVSNEFGARKPAPELFEHAKSELPAETFVYVGDSLEEDVLPAREHGFETVYVGNEHPPETTLTVSTVEDLATVLGPLLD